MNLMGAIVLYLSIWFLVLFVVVAFRRESQADMGEVVPGTPEGAPHNLRLWPKLFITTIVTTILWLICAHVITGGYFTREDVESWDQLIRR